MRVSGSGFSASSFGFRLRGVTFKQQGLGLRVKGSKQRVQSFGIEDSRSRVWGSGVRHQTCGRPLASRRASLSLSLPFPLSFSLSVYLSLPHPHQGLRTGPPPTTTNVRCRLTSCFGVWGLGFAVWSWGFRVRFWNFEAESFGLNHVTLRILRLALATALVPTDEA